MDAHAVRLTNGAFCTSTIAFHPLMDYESLLAGQQKDPHD